MIIAVGFKVNNERAVRFRKWAGQIVKDYTIQGGVMDKDLWDHDVLYYWGSKSHAGTNGFAYGLSGVPYTSSPPSVSARR